MQERPQRPQWLNDRQVSEMTGIAVQTLRNWRQKGTGPKFDRPTKKCVRYRLSEVEKFMQGE
jgi:predicted site-specific integrase-resolvase